jgi:PAS domain S-box-containing protein
MPVIGSRSGNPASRAAWGFVIGLALVTGSLVVVAWFGMETLSEVRSYVGGEGLWSKGQKNATHALSRYATSRDEALYRQFLAEIAVPLGDHRARLELDKPDYDPAVVLEGFRAGGNAPEDIPGMAHLYRNFRWLDFLKRSIHIWQLADEEVIERLLAVAGRLRAAAPSEAGDPAFLKAQLAEIEAINARATVLENDFSSTLGEAARWVRALMAAVLAVVALALVAVGASVTLRLSGRLIRSEAATRHSEAIYRTLVQAAPFGICGSRSDGSLVAVNPALVAMLGYPSEEELLRVNTRDLYVDAAARARLVEQLGARGREEGVVQWRRRDGREITVQLAARPARVSPEGPEQFNVLVEDITERLHVQEQLRHAQKMEAVGQLAGGIAHDFNNLLTALLGSSSLLLEELPPGHPARVDAEEIQLAGLRASELTGQLLAFGSRQARALQVLELGSVVEQSRKLLERLLGDTITLRCELGAGLAPLKADRGQLEQVLVNLAVNARDAMAGRGTLTVRTAVVPKEAVPADPSQPAPVREHLVLSVSDTGCGMDEATRERIFEPFFTTKPHGKGTGLGLASVYGIVHQTGGRIVVRSAPGQGATFDLYFPSTDEAVAPAPAPPAAIPRPDGARTVLVVEDRDDVRRLTCKLLRNFGYLVLEAAGGQEALRIASEHAGSIHLLLTDVVMPGMSGSEVATALSLRRPETRVLYMSGYADDSIVRHGVLEPGVALLAKPFTPESLARKVGEALA